MRLAQRVACTDRELGAELSIQVIHDSIAISFQNTELPLSVIWLQDETSALGRPPRKNRETNGK